MPKQSKKEEILNQTYFESVVSISSGVWIEILYILCMYCSLLPINNFTSDILQVKFGLSSIEAGARYGEIYLVSGFTLIFIGIFNDKFGGISATQVLAAVCSILGNFWWAYYP